MTMVLVIIILIVRGMVLNMESLLLRMTSLIAFVREETLPLVLAVHFLFDAQLHLFADDGVEDESFVRRYRLPVLDPAGVDRPCAFSEGEHDDRDWVLCVVFLVLGHGRDARGPDLVFVHGCAGDLPGQGFADAADLVEDGFRAWARCDEDVVG